MFCFTGYFLGVLLPTGRDALGIGLIVFFIIMMLCGAGPPREVMTSPMRIIGDIMPFTHVGVLLQDTWLGFGWNVKESLIVAAYFIGASALVLKLFRWD